MAKVSVGVKNSVRMVLRGCLVNFKAIHTAMYII